MAVGKHLFQWLVAGILVVSVSGGCVSHIDARRQFMEQFKQGDYAQARETLYQVGGKRKIDFLVDTCDMAMVLSRSGRYTESNKFLERADQRIRSYFTKNVSDVLAVIGWNESSATYKGEDFERNMVDILQALNYLVVGNLEKARVEAAQVNEKLKDFVMMLRRNGIHSGFTGDPFAHYISGLAFEASAMKEPPGSDRRNFLLDGARISYIRSRVDYNRLGGRYGLSAPPWLDMDLENVQAQLCNPKERSEVGRPCIEDGAYSEIVFLLGVGLIPHKESRKWVMSDGQDTFVVTYPEFENTPTRVTNARVVFNNGSSSARISMVYDLGRIAVTVNKERTEQVKERAVARGAARYAAKKAARLAAQAAAASARNNSGGGLFGAIAGLAATAVSAGISIAEAVEVADTRSWMTLPDKYLMSRLKGPPGVYDLQVQFTDAGGNIVNTVPVKANMVANGRTFVVLHSSDAMGPRRTRYFGPRPAGQVETAEGGEPTSYDGSI